MQTLNKNGIPVQTKENAEKHRKLKRQAERMKRMQALEDKKLGMKRFALINDEAEVEVVVPHFSPIVELLKSDGWREIFYISLLNKRTKMCSKRRRDWDDSMGAL